MIRNRRGDECAARRRSIATSSTTSTRWRGHATALFVADDVDRAWDELGPHLLHDAVTAASYRHDDASVASISTATTVDELRADHAYQIITTEEAVDLVRASHVLPLVPLCGGLAPAPAGTYLKRAADAVAHARR